MTLRIGFHYELGVPAWGAPGDLLAAIVDHAVAAEAAGLDAVWLIEDEATPAAGLAAALAMRGRRVLLVDLIERAKAAGFHSLIGGSSADQPASIVLQERLGFQRVAHLKEVGYKFGQWLDVVYLQLML